MTEFWSTGDLTRAGGVTVRMLHHYDEIGLLVPGGRTAGGHRRYTTADVHPRPWNGRSSAAQCPMWSRSVSAAPRSAHRRPRDPGAGGYLGGSGRGSAGRPSMLTPLYSLPSQYAANSSSDLRPK